MYEIIDDKEYFVLETKPKKELNSFYSKHISWVDKDNMTILKEESYDKKGELKKRNLLNMNILIVTLSLPV